MSRARFMPDLIRPDGAEIHYEITGDGYPLLLLAPGGVSSEIASWRGSAFNPIEVFSDDFMVIAMDQRHAGRSRAPLTAFSYQQMMGDQLAVLNDLRLASAHVMGGCIGCAYALNLMDEAPARITAAVLQDPVGLDDTNTMGTFYYMFNETIRVARAEGLDAVIAAAEQNPRFIDNAAAGPFGQRLRDQPGFADAMKSLGREGYIALVIDFRDGIWPWQEPFFSVNAVAIERMTHSMLILPGSDAFHPTGVAQRVAELAPAARCLEVDCRARGNLTETVEAVRAFLLEHVPGS